MRTEEWIYVALGDSITAPREGVKVYVQSLEDNARSLGLGTIVNSGVGGWKTSDVLHHFDEKCLKYRPQLVSIMLGTNDHAIYKGHSSPAVSLSAYQNNLADMIVRIRTISEASIILMTPPFVATYTNEAGTDTSQQRLLEYVQAMKDISRELKTGLVDVNLITAEAVNHSDSNYRERFTHRKDGVHLNTAGQALIVPCLEQAITRERTLR